MTSFYQPVDPLWHLKLAIFWGSWLVWPALLGLGWLCWRRWRNWSTARRGSMLLWWLALALFIDARFIERYRIVDQTTELELGFRARLAVISDPHLGIYKDERFLARVVDRINDLGVDAVLIAGDLTYLPERDLRILLAPLARLKMPALSVPGNHDEEAPGPQLQAELRQALKQHGVQPVEYGHVRMNGFNVVGLGDRFAGKDDLRPLQAAPRDQPIVVLLHNPDTAMTISRGAAALVVAGHTHGGQIRIPWLYRVAIPTQHPFDRGLHTAPPVPTFVTAGLGESGLPLRLLDPPVIDILNIR